MDWVSKELDLSDVDKFCGYIEILSDLTDEFIKELENNGFEIEETAR